MPAPFRVLIIDDSEKDALLVEGALRKNWPALASERVDTAAALRGALKGQTWDCVLCDMVIPGFGASEALEILGKCERDLPVVVLSGVIGIEDAVGLMKAGAHDFVRKDELARLVPALERAILEVENLQEKKNVESRLRKSEERFRDFAESAADRFWETDENHRFIFMTERIEGHWTMPRDAMIGKARWEVPGIDREGAFWDAHRADMNARRPFRDFRYARKDEQDRTCYLRVSGKPVFDQEGRFEGYRGTSNDETVEVEALTETEDLRMRFSEAMERVPEGIVFWDADDRFVMCNEHFRRQYPKIGEFFVPGMKVGDLIRKIVEAHAPLEAKGHEEEWIAQEIAKRKQPFSETDIFVDGKWLRIRRHRLTDGSTVSFSSDITEEKRREEALRESEAKYQDLYEHAPDMFASADAETERIVECNETMATKLGYSKDQLIGQPFSFLYHPDCAEEMKKAAKTFVETGEVRETELEMRRKDGRKIPVILNVSAVRDGHGKVLRSRSVAHDITEHKAAEAKLDEFQRELNHLARTTTMGEMAAGLAHELNQPLTAIANYAEATMQNLRSGKSKPEELFPVMELVSDQAMRAGEIVHKMRGYVDRTAPKTVPIDVRQAIREAVTLMEGEIHLGGVELDLNLSDPIPEINADRIQVQQVVLNLVRNAIEAMVDIEPSHRQLTISTTMTNEDAVEIAVTDSGPGIPPETLKKIFDSFYTTKESGLGMGLSISRTIARAHGGALWATTEDGTGTIFHFTLPVGAGDEDDHA